VVFQDFFSAFAPFRHLAGAVFRAYRDRAQSRPDQTQVAAALGIKRTNFVGLLNNWKNARWPSATGLGRQAFYALYLTPDGAALMRKLRPVLKAHEPAWSRRSAKPAATKLVALLHDIADAGETREPRNGAGIRERKLASTSAGSAET